MDGNKLKKTFEIIKSVVVWIVLVIVVISTMFTLFNAYTSREKDRYLFGYKIMIVTSDSMMATHFKSGDIIFSKRIEAGQVQEGDVITFVSQAMESYGKIVTHKVKNVTKDIDGNLAFETYGTTTGVSDSALATKVLGIYKCKISKVGKFFIFLKTPVGYILFVFTPISLIIIFQLVNCIKALKEYDKQ